MVDPRTSDQASLARLHAVVSGQVQGVGFRMFVQETAARLNLSGWVRNLYRGEVEVLAEGSRENLGKLLTALHRGPRSAYVTGVKPSWDNPTGEFTAFRVRPTA